MMALQKRTYLPRSTMDFSATRAVFEFAEKYGISFGKALETLLLESSSFNQALDDLSKGADWFKNDVESFKESVRG